MYKAWLRSVARNRSLQGADLRVFLTLMASTQGSTAEISQAEIARDLGIENGNVSRSIKKLVENGIIQKKYATGKLVGYRFPISSSEQV